jgi:hypothetical protein
MKKTLPPLLLFASSPAMGETNPDRALHDFYAQWIIALIPIVIGLVPHLMTVYVTAFQIPQCMKKRETKFISSMPFIGPALICLGLSWAPSDIPFWSYLIPWALEISTGIALQIAYRANFPKPDGRP